MGEKSEALICQLTPQMSTMAMNGSDHGQVTGIPFRSPTWVAGMGCLVLADPSSRVILHYLPRHIGRELNGK